MVLPNSDRAPRTPPYSGARSKEGQLGFAYAAIMLYGETFQNSSATDWLCNFPGRLPPSPNESHDPLKATPAGLTLSGFRLFRVRSPLLAESLSCFLFLEVLRWFTSLRCLPQPMDSAEDLPVLAGRGFPIRKSPGQSLFAAHRGLSQLTASFIDF